MDVAVEDHVPRRLRQPAPAFRFIFISIDLSIYLSISIYVSIYLSIHPSIYLFIYLSIYLSIHIIDPRRLRQPAVTNVSNLRQVCFANLALVLSSRTSRLSSACEPLGRGQRTRGVHHRSERSSALGHQGEVNVAVEHHIPR